MTSKKQHVVVIGGGAAGFFFAANASELYSDMCKITILEQGRDVLQKVKISGGGRCNVTHNCFDPKELIKNYPRGAKELLGPFYRFNPEHTIQWFEWHGVTLKSEIDNRMFPISDSSQTIIDCLNNVCKSGGVEIQTHSKVVEFAINSSDSSISLKLIDGSVLRPDKLFLAPGSSKVIWEILEEMGIEIVSPVPSLFTFIIKDERIADLSGISIPNVQISLDETDYCTSGPLLITHKGMSGPAILKLSALGAIHFYESNYLGQIRVNFLPELQLNDLKTLRINKAKSQINNHRFFNLSKRLYQNLIQYTKIDPNKKWGTLSNNEIEIIFEAITAARFEIIGQNRFKDEFVTAGGVELKEVNFRKFSLKKFPNIHLAGEVLNIDAVTGGFNFQAAWTGAYLAANELFS